jgi:hypothetical protein
MQRARLRHLERFGLAQKRLALGRDAVGEMRGAGPRQGHALAFAIAGGAEQRGGPERERHFVAVAVLRAAVLRLPLTERGVR